MERRGGCRDPHRGPACTKRLVHWALRKQGALEACQPPPNVPRRIHIPVGGQSQRGTQVSQLLDSVYVTCDRVYKIMVFVLKMGKVSVSVL